MTTRMYNIYFLTYGYFNERIKLQIFEKKSSLYYRLSELELPSIHKGVSLTQIFTIV
jgi:hypothetical protein